MFLLNPPAITALRIVFHSDHFWCVVSKKDRFGRLWRNSNTGNAYNLVWVRAEMFWFQALRPNWRRVEKRNLTRLFFMATRNKTTNQWPSLKNCFFVKGAHFNFFCSLFGNFEQTYYGGKQNKIKGHSLLRVLRVVRKNTPAQARFSTLLLQSGRKKVISAKKVNSFPWVSKELNILFLYFGRRLL